MAAGATGLQHRLHAGQEAGFAERGDAAHVRAAARVVHVLAAQIHPLADDALLGRVEEPGVVDRAGRRVGVRGARSRASLQRFAEQDLRQPARTRNAVGTASHRLDQGRAADDHRHAVFEACLRQPGGRVDDRVADQQLIVRDHPAAAAEAGAQVEPGRVGMAAGAGVGATGAACTGPDRRDVVGVVDHAADGSRRGQVVRRIGVAAVAHADRCAGLDAGTRGVGPDVAVDLVGQQVQRRRVEAGAQRGHGFAGLVLARQRGTDAGGHRVDDGAGVQRGATARAVATVAGAALARAHLDPVQVGL